MEIIYLFVLLLINLILKLKTLNSPLDNDTSNHIYTARTKIEHKDIFNSYIFGVKFTLIWCYVILYRMVQSNVYAFRYMNIFSSSVILSLFFVFFEIDSFFSVEFYGLLLLTLLLNSHWVYYTTSASEFHESLWLLGLLGLLCLDLSFDVNYYSILLQLICLLVLVSFKAVNIVYVFAILAAYFFKYGVDSTFIGLVVLFLGCIVGLYLFYKKNKKSSVSKYKSSRSFLSAKNLRYLVLNIHFVLFISVLSLYNFFYGNEILKIILLLTWAIFLVQRNYTTYFFYPLVVVNFFFLFANQLILIKDEWILFLIGFVSIGHILMFILIPSSRWSDIIFRKYFVGYIYWEKYLDNRDKQVKYLSKTITSKERVYMWGSNIALLVLAELNHTEGTFFSHNHLLLWSSIKDEKSYAIEFIKKNRPAFIIESECVNGLYFPFNEFKESYEKIQTIENMNVYKLKKI